MIGFKALIFAAGLSLGLSGFGVQVAPQSGGYVGHVAESQAFIAIVTAGDKALAYLCDGGEIAEWFRGPVAEDGSLDLHSEGGWVLEARLTASGILGTVTLEGAQPLTFTALLATGEAGLYRATRTIGDMEYVGGWIVDLEGEQRGAVVGGVTRQAAPNLNLQTMQAEVAGLGTFSAEPVTPAEVEAMEEP